MRCLLVCPHWGLRILGLFDTLPAWTNSTGLAGSFFIFLWSRPFSTSNTKPPFLVNRGGVVFVSITQISCYKINLFIQLLHLTVLFR